MTIDYEKLDELWIEFYKEYGMNPYDTVRIGHKWTDELGIPRV